ncbi:MAG: insulinase family protein, partial [Thermoanaerobaculia bacterium]
MRTLRLALLSFLLAAFAFPALAQVVDDWRDIDAPPLRKFEVQQPKRIELPNGMVVFLQEDHELPLVSGTAIVRGGGREAPADKTGLIEIYGEAWRTGGTESRTGDELDDFLETRAAKVETAADDDSTSVSFNTLVEQLDPVFDVWIGLLRNPAFREDKIDLAKRQLNTGIARRNDSPTAIARREAAKLLWGADSPYARVPEYDTVAAVDREDLLAWHGRYVHPNNIIIGISGDFDARRMEQRLRRAFGSWKRGPEAPLPDIEPAPTPGVYFVPKEDVTQSTIVLIHPGARKDDPDYHGIQLLNEIFAGGFSGRLLNRIRTQQGLAYSVGGGIGTGWDHLGSFQVTMGTKSGSTVQAIESLYTEIADIRDNLVAPEELAFAKESILNSWVFLRDSKEEVLDQRMTLEFHGYPADFLERYRAGLDLVTIEDIQRIARERIHPDELAILVVGREEDLDQPLSSLGEVKVLDITIPEPGASEDTTEEPVSEADAAEGRALLEKMRAFLGGDALAGVESIRTQAEVDAVTPAGPMHITQTMTLDFAPARFHQRMQMPMGEMQMVLAGESAFMKGPMGTQDLPASMRANLAGELWVDPLFLAKNLDDPRVTATAQGTETIDGVEAAKVAVDVDGTAFTLWIDPATGTPVQRARTSMAMGEQVDEVVRFSDWKTEGGLRYASKLEITGNGEP